MIARVAALAADTDPVRTEPARTIFVGIDGFGGAGKTTLAQRIAAAVPRAVVVHVDDFSGPDVAEWDWGRFRAQVLEPLRAGRPARYQVWDWDADRGGPWRDVAEGAVLVLEGVSATRVEVGVDWDLTVWVHAPPDVRRQRAVARDGEQIWPVWRDRWIPSEQAYAAREQPERRVDLIVDGSGTMEVP